MHKVLVNPSELYVILGSLFCGTKDQYTQEFTNLQWLFFYSSMFTSLADNVVLSRNNTDENLEKTLGRSLI